MKILTTFLITIGLFLGRSYAQSNNTIKNVVSSVKTLKSTLNRKQIKTMSYDYNSELRSYWSNLPTGVLSFERNGIRMGDLTEKQLAAVFALLKASLSEEGYTLISQIVRADEILARDPIRAKRMGWTEDNYWLAIFGEPSTTNIWALQFGGHHLALNITFKGDQISLSPTLLAIEPAHFNDGGKSFKPMQSFIDAGVAVIGALDAATKTESMISHRPEELYAGAGGDNVIPKLEGSIVGQWTVQQQELLLTLINNWVGVLPNEAAATRLAEIKKAFNNTYFAWNGPTDGTEEIYYRIQNADLIIEFSTQGAVGAADSEGHYHSIYRQPKNEYGAGLK